MKRLSYFGLFVFLVGWLTACGSEPDPTPTPTLRPTATPSATPEPMATATPTFTATPTETPTPTQTPTATPTATATATPTPTAVPTVALGEVETSAMGFSYQSPLNYIMEDQGDQVFFQSADDLVVGSLTLIDETFAEPVEDILADYVTELGNSMGGMLGISEPVAYTVGGVEGAAAEIFGLLFEATVAGRGVAVVLPDGRLFFAFALVKTTGNELFWFNEGGATFDALLGSVAFLKATPTPRPPAATATSASTSNSACPVSTDASYGYTEGNPIRVGGDGFGGPARARAYLDNLRGPNGESISYDRLGSLPSGNTILDIYEITGLPQSVSLYVDQYSYETLQAPLGFTCTAPFPLSAP